MPRGSKAGERRGGRQRGTPNKTTALKNAVLCAAAAKPDASPLDFMLGLMRDPAIPTDLQLEMAAAAVPFVHAKPQAPPRKRTNPMDSSPLKGASDFTVQKIEEKLSVPEQCGEGGGDLSPLNFLLGVMKDPDAAPKQRIKAARVAARYTHVPVVPDKMPAVDEYGFAMSRTLAKTIKDDWWRLEILESGRMGAVSADHVGEASRIRARQAERDKFLECPPGYFPQQDLKRRGELLEKKWRGQLTMAEETELAYVVARIAASQASSNRTPAGRARRRIEELKARVWMRAAGRAKPLGLTPAEVSEIDQLCKEFPGAGTPHMTLEKAMELYEFKRKNQTTDSERPNGADDGTGAPANAGSPAPEQAR